MFLSEWQWRAMSAFLKYEIWNVGIHVSKCYCH